MRNNETANSAFVSKQQNGSQHCRIEGSTHRSIDSFMKRIVVSEEFCTFTRDELRTTKGTTTANASANGGSVPTRIAYSMVN